MALTQQLPKIAAPFKQVLAQHLSKNVLGFAWATQRNLSE